MFKCTQCSSEFTRKDALVRHGKTHTGIRFPCSVCPSTFTYKTSLTKHLKNVHGFVNVPAHRQPNAQIDQPVPQIQIGPQIFVPDIPAGSSNELSESSVWGNDIDEMDMVRLLENLEKDEEKSRKSKRMRMNATTSEFREVASVFNG
ncbi:unnamed protein product [Macrosiphum euphorbiae]|uniref:C2H2-type domain-containing protein n=1 Tax=Macrosiphum euphorbiae TaxID=13131 RepID=A0AAV0WLF2_9HEMI|nr:unnamed protein product [Macrosiphum euphorbiae]